MGRRAVATLLVGAAAFATSASGDWRSGPVEAAHAATLATYELNISVAPGLAPSAVVIGTGGTLYLRDRASVTAPLSNVGVGASELGVEAKGVDIYSEPNLTLRNRAQLSGAAILKGTVTRGLNTIITGGVTTGASFADPAGKTFLVAWPTGGGTNHDLQPNQALTLLSGVAYGNITVKSNATLTITAGEHFVKSLTVEPNANVVLLDGTDRISLFVKDSLTWRGKLTTQSGAAADWLVGYLGTQRVPLESAFRGLLLAPNAEVTLATISTGKHTGQFFAKKVEVQPDVAVVFQPSKFFNEPTPSAGSLPDANDPRCGKSSLALGGHVKDGTLDRYGSISQTTPTPGCPLVELCTSDQPGAPKADLAALNARLNSPTTPTQPCDTYGKAAAGNCPANPNTIDRSKQCNADLDCPGHAAGDVCVPYCVDKACTQVQHGCAKRYDCTGVDNDDPRGCDTQIAYQCTDANDWGATVPTQVSDSLPPKTNVTLAVPAGSIPQVKAYVDVDTSSFCDGLSLASGTVANGDEYTEPVAQPGKTPSAVQEEGSPVILGNSTWGLFANPRVFHKAQIDHRRLDQFKLNVEAQGSLVAGAKVFGKAITGLDAKGGAKITQCGADASGKFQLFGETIAGLNGVNTHSDACETAFDTLYEVSTLLTDTAQLARKLVKLYDPSLGPDEAQAAKVAICGEVVSALGLNDPVVTINCATTSVSAEAWVNFAVQRYKNQAATYAAKRLAYFQSAFATETSSAGLPFLDLGEPFTIVGVHTAIPIGPVSLVVDVQVFGHWGLKGTIDYGLDLGTLTGSEVSGDPSLSAGATIKPEVALHAALYVGVGIDLGFAGASVGLEGDLNLIEASAPVRVQMGIKRTTKNETAISPSHDYQQSDFAGNAIAGIPVGKAYTWDGFWKFGAAFHLNSLSGDLNAAARVHFLFFSKTFRKKIAHWEGFEKTFPIATVGGATPLPSDLLSEALSFKGELGFGNFTDQVAFTQLDKVGSGTTMLVSFDDSKGLTGCADIVK